MILLNKLVVDTYGINFPYAIIFCQNLSALCLIAVLRGMNLIQYPAFDAQVARKWLPLTIFFVVMLISSIKSLHTMSVAIQTIIKNLAVVLTACGDKYFFQKPISPTMLVAFALMITGSYMGTVQDKWVTAWGLMWTCINVVSTVGYVLYMKLLLHQVSQEIGRYGPVFYNNLLSLPFLILPAAITCPGLADKLQTTSGGGALCLTLMLLVGAVMTFASFWCMKLTSPTAYSVMGSLNKVPLSLIGIVLFGTYPTTLGAMGITVSLTGGTLYAWATSQMNSQRDKKGPGDNADTPGPMKV
jgi:GDP-mannose transporter